jgi:hypothetical protein
VASHSQCTGPGFTLEDDAVLRKTAATTLLTTGAVLLVALFAPPRADAQMLGPQQRLCDPEYQDCRADVLTYIAQENVEIDFGFWLMDDAEYSNALVAAWQRGVKIRLLMDPRCTSEHPACSGINDQLSKAGLPMRNSIASGILHWKVAIFAGQGQVEFSGANYSPFEMVPATPYQNYTDEIVMYTNDPSIVHSFMSKFDDLWTSTIEFANYANVTGPPTRSYAVYPEDPQLNFPYDEGYRSRAISAYGAEHLAIDVAMFRITDEAESDAIIAALNRGIPVRLYTDETEYRNPDRLWDAYNVDKMYHAGVTVRLDDHQGINHEKLVILRGQGMTIFGSSNWTSPSSDSQREHNMFTTQSWIFTWAQNQFDRKWSNGLGFAESKPFTPLPPDVPTYNLPANGAIGISTTGVATTGVAPIGPSLSWNGGLWGQLYDIYFGASPDPPLFAQDQKLGPSHYPTDYRAYALPELQSNTTYYWRVVSKTMAEVAAPGPVWSFTTGSMPGAPSPLTPPNPVDPPSPSTTPSGGSTTPAGSCLGTAPFPGAVCVGNGWVPGSEVPSGGSTTPSGGSSSGGSTTSTGSCLGTAPFPGAVCVGNGWVPGSEVPSVGSPTTNAGPTSGGSSSGSTTSAGSCLGAAPFPGAVCVGNGWVPGSEVPNGGSTPSGGSSSGGSSTGGSTTSTASCLGTAPFPGAVCVGNGWVPGGSTGGSATATAGGCLTPDPFTAIGGGVCVNGGWRPKG